MPLLRSCRYTTDGSNHCGLKQKFTPLRETRGLSGVEGRLWPLKMSKLQGLHLRHLASQMSEVQTRPCHLTSTIPHGTGMSNALLVTVVRPSRVSKNIESRGDAWRRCQSTSALFQADSRAALTPHAATKSSR
jgi:hypothetical protein